MGTQGAEFFHFLLGIQEMSQKCLVPTQALIQRLRVLSFAVEGDRDFLGGECAFRNIVDAIRPRARHGFEVKLCLFEKVVKVERNDERLTFLIRTLTGEVKVFGGGAYTEFKEQLFFLKAVHLAADAASEV